MAKQTTHFFYERTSLVTCIHAHLPIRGISPGPTVALKFEPTRAAFRAAGELSSTLRRRRSRTHFVVLMDFWRVAKVHALSLVLHIKCDPGKLQTWWHHKYSESVSSGLAFGVEQALDWRKTEFVTTDQLTKI